MNKVKVICKQCGKAVLLRPFEAKDRLYCSKKCSQESQKIIKVVNCARCGKELKRAPWHADRPGNNYCSKECQSATKIINCEMCDKERVIPLSAEKEHNFCSRSCASRWQKVNGLGRQSTKVKFNCPICQTEFYRQPNQIKRVKNQYCSKKCFYEAHQITMGGKNNPAWRGGFDPYYGPNWKRQAYEARKRDGFKCRRCGILESDLSKKLHVHHIIPLREFNRDFKRANAIGNLMSLCPSCHKTLEWNPDQMS